MYRDETKSNIELLVGATFILLVAMALELMGLLSVFTIAIMLFILGYMIVRSN